MRRPPDWPERLVAFLEERAARPFRWGKHDCCLFAADWILACTGEDPAAPWRGRYRSASGARRLVRQAGGLVALVNSLRFSQYPAPLFAKRGDLVLWDGPEGESLGVCTGIGFAAPGKDGLDELPMRLARVAWPVGWEA